MITKFAAIQRLRGMLAFRQRVAEQFDATDPADKAFHRAREIDALAFAIRELEGASPGARLA